MGADFSALTAEVTRLKGVVPSIVAAFSGVADQIAAAVAANDAGDNSQLATLADDVRGQVDALATAITTNP